MASFQHAPARTFGAGLAALLLCHQVAIAAYPPPACAPGGTWIYAYEGEAAAKGLADNADGGTSLDGTWTWFCGGTLKNMAVPPAQDLQCTWDGTGPGTHTTPFAPGGLSILSEDAGATTFLRMQDAGDYSVLAYNNPPIAAGNQKFLFGHNLADDVGGSVAETILERGVTLNFRIRLATSGPLDDLYPSAGGGPLPWPAAGDGYVNIFTIREAMDQQALRFGLALDSDLPGGDFMNGRNGLVMNRLSTSNNRYRPNAVSDATNSNGEINVFEVPDPTSWHEFWMTIERIGEPIVVDPAAVPPTISKGVGTYQVKVWMDGGLTPAGTFIVNANIGGSDFNFDNYLQMGLSSDSASGAIDVDFLRYAVGAYPPAAAAVLAVDQRVARFADIAKGESHPGFTYSVRNNSATPSSLVYTVTELDASQNPTAVSWLSLTDSAGDPKTGGTVAVGEIDTLVARVDTNDPTLILGTVSTAYIRFTDNNTPPSSILREVDLTLRTWNVGGAVHREYRVFTPFAAESTIVPVTHTITNGAATDLNLFVTSSRAYLTYPYSDPTFLTVPAGQTVSVTGTFNKNAPDLPDFGDAGTVTVTFTNAADPNDRITRNVNLRMILGEDVRMFKYLGNVDPTATDSAGPDQRFVVQRGGLSENVTGEVVQDSASPTRSAWHIVDNDTDGRIVYRPEIISLSRGLPTVRDAGVTVVACMKVNSWSAERGPQLFLFHADASGITGNNVLGSIGAWGHWGGQDGRLEEQLRGAVKEVPGNSDYVIIRMTAVGQYTDTDDTPSNLSRLARRHLSMYVNEDPTPTAILDNNGAAFDWVNPNSGGGFGFGAGSTRGLMDVRFAWVAGTNAGAFAPGEEVHILGQSLIPDLCTRFPFADADGDNDVDLNDFGALQACYTGTGIAASEACQCFDRPAPALPEGDGDVDAEDVEAFIACGTGANVPFDEGTAALAGCAP